MSSHELVAFPNGSYSVKPRLSPEAMHSHIGPWQEAELVYVRQSGLAEELRQPGAPLVLYDLGLGIAANSLAALECFSSSRPRRDLQIISFEKHLDALKLALENAERFPWMERHRATLEQMLRDREWSTHVGAARISWRLCEGDFLDQSLDPYPPADFVFFDFYSPKANPALWELECFQKIRAVAAPRARLLTYSASTSARAAMLLAGFYVGRGHPTGSKTETTVAAACLADLERPLGEDWLEKLNRSEKPLPPGSDPALRELFLSRIQTHLQFRSQDSSVLL